MINNHRTGPLRYSWAVACSSLSKVPKAVLHALSLYLDWESWTCHPSVTTIAANCGYGLRAVQAALADLAELSVIRYDRESIGGHTHRLRIDIARLEALTDRARGAQSDRARGAQSYSASGIHPPRTASTTTPHPTTANRAPGAQKQTTEQTSEHTTATTGERGSGSGVARERLIDAMIAAGVGRADAELLADAPQTTQERIAFAIERANTAAPNHRGRYIASLIRKPAAELDGFEAFVSDLLNKRQRRYVMILDNAGKTARSGAANAPRLAAGANAIREAWPDGQALAQSGAIPDQMLLTPSPDFPALFDLLASAAMALCKSTFPTGCHPATHGVDSDHGKNDRNDCGRGEGERPDALRDREGGGRGP